MANIESVKLPNGSEYNIKDAISGYALQSEMSVTDGTGTDADKTTIQLKSGTSTTVLKTHQSISGKADKVTGGTNGNLASLDSNGNLTDAGVALNISTPANGQVMTYNSTSSKWENATMDLSSKADKTDITSIIATGATNTTGATITAGTYFYLNDALVKAKADIASGASYTSGTNYEAVTVGEELDNYMLNNNVAYSQLVTSVAPGDSYTAPADGIYALYVAGDGTNTAYWYLGTAGMLVGTSGTATIIMPIFLKKGTTIKTRSVPNATLTYYVMGYYTFN